MTQERPERVQKILARLGVASRRAAETLIVERRVTVNGKTAVLGERALAGTDEIAVDGIPVETDVISRYFALNKPTGVVSTVDDPRGRKTVVDLIPEEVREGARLFPVGRLDMDSSGLILLTNDGFLANRMLHPRFGVPREYLVEVEPVPRPDDLSSLRNGVELEDGVTAGAKVSLLGERAGRAQVRMTIGTGKKRQIRRSFESLGYRVGKLCRVRYGSLGLGALKPGEYRELLPSEVRGLYRETGLDARGYEEEQR